MTPELKTACELVFQEHKASQQIKWSRDSFRGQISIGLSELAKETLVQKHIIILPNKSKKIVTFLNPVVATAGSVEEAERLIANSPEPIVMSRVAETPKKSVQQPVIAEKRSPVYLALPGTVHKETSVAATTSVRWYLKPVFVYFVWPICAALAGATITFLINTAFMELFWR
jgi:hypothetical protein